VSSERIIIRTSSNLSFAGELIDMDEKVFGKGLLLKLSLNSEIKMWFPNNEIDCVIYPDGVVQKGDEIKYG